MALDVKAPKGYRKARNGELKQPKAKPTEHENAMFADVVKGAMERGIDVLKIIADELRKKRRK
jgi:hypothetical protein